MNNTPGQKRMLVTNPRSSNKRKHRDEESEGSDNNGSSESSGIESINDEDVRLSDIDKREELDVEVSESYKVGHYSLDIIL